MLRSRDHAERIRGLIDLSRSAMDKQRAVVMDGERCSVIVEDDVLDMLASGPAIDNPFGRIEAGLPGPQGLTRLHRRRCARPEKAAPEGMDTQGWRRRRLLGARHARQIVRKSRAVSGVAAGWARPAGRTMASVR